MRKFATHLAILIVGVAAGIGGVAVAGNDTPAAHTSATDSRIVNELRKLNTNVDDLNDNVQLINKTIGGYSNISPTDSIRSLLDDIKRGNASTCRAIAEHSYDCPIG
jgi:uncharacterized protein YlxW (UPF0749 family)